MKARERARGNKGKWSIACVVIGLALAVSIAPVSCSGVASAGRVGASQAISDVTDSVVDNVGLPEANVSGEAKTEPNEQEADDATGKENTESGARDESANRGEAGSPQGSAADLQRQESASESKGNLAAPPQNTAQKTWVEDTERVWAVDKEAWTESVPICGTVEVSICNICGTDITGNTSAHAKEHMKAGEGSGHHSETRQKIIGYNTVSHSEEGHWETKAVGGRWE
mgnify:FL=1